jgi:excisionase family DNA binding protein
MDVASLLSVRVAADRLGISASRLYLLIEQGRVATVAVAGRRLIDAAELERFAGVPRVAGRRAARADCS